MKFQFKPPALCTFPGNSSFVVPPYKVHVKLVKWRFHEGFAMQYDPVLTPEEEKELFSQQGLLFVEHGNDAKLELVFDAKITYDYSDLI